jgi:hypothetical protein
MKRILIIIILALLLIISGMFIYNRYKTDSGITVNTSSPAIVKQIKSLNRLETASFTIEKIIDAGTNSNNAFTDFLYGDRILLIAHGEVIAGIDLSAVSEKDIVVEGSSITLTLPQPQILTTTIDNSKTRVYDRKQGLLTKGNKDLESEARKAAEQSIRQAACEGKILDTATENARKQLTTLLKGLGFTTIGIEIPQGSC